MEQDGLPKIVDPPLAKTLKEMQSPQARIDEVSVVPEPPLAQNDKFQAESVDPSLAGHVKNMEISNQLPDEKLDAVEPLPDQNKDDHLDQNDPPLAKPDNTRPVEPPGSKNETVDVQAPLPEIGSTGQIQPLVKAVDAQERIQPSVKTRNEILIQSRNEDTATAGKLFSLDPKVQFLFQDLFVRISL